MSKQELQFNSFSELLENIITQNWEGQKKGKGQIEITFAMHSPKQKQPKDYIERFQVTNAIYSFTREPFTTHTLNWLERMYPFDKYQQVHLFDTLKSLYNTHGHFMDIKNEK